MKYFFFLHKAGILVRYQLVCKTFAKKNFTWKYINNIYTDRHDIHPAIDITKWIIHIILYSLISSDCIYSYDSVTYLMQLKTILHAFLNKNTNVICYDFLVECNRYNLIVGLKFNLIRLNSYKHKKMNYLWNEWDFFHSN